jgi:hypothetical protein
MKRNNVLTQKVNSLIALCFIAAFGIFTVSMTLKAPALEDPISNSIAATAASIH